MLGVFQERSIRRAVEGVFSVLKGYFGMRPYAISLDGLFMKIYTAMIAYNLHRL